ncbi:hypothetical protein Pcinc_026522 [Petrolisthes cinctipes]|uniref:Uncharacterized protein n=1 Tax=Petrolisthes cinctipes TaxID=88211 RepID=A0AAE1F6Q1_PETCI|nr:hypothetical protein Pcinc_026522 [Petrolisthes cinctipes]
MKEGREERKGKVAKETKEEEEKKGKGRRRRRKRRNEREVAIETKEKEKKGREGGEKNRLKDKEGWMGDRMGVHGEERSGDGTNESKGKERIYQLVTNIYTENMRKNG